MDENERQRILDNLRAANFDKLAHTMKRLNDHIKQREDTHKAELATAKTVLELAKNEVQRRLIADGVSSVNTGSGSLQSVVRSTYSIKGHSSFFEWLEKTGSYSMLEPRISGPAARQFIDENGELPPGVALNEKRLVRLVPKRKK